MKYQKPAAREMGKVALAAGVCTSGTWPTEQCQSGYTNIGPCTNGGTAGQTCGLGFTPNSPTPCTGGSQVTQCISGFVAGLE